MIERRFICNLCRQDAHKIGSGWSDPVRVKFESMNKIKLCPLTDDQASETVICGQCVTMLKDWFINR